MTSARTVRLHGGPYHGKAVAIPVGNDHFHIVGWDPVSLLKGITEDQDNPSNVETREGTYSQVSGRGNENEFEWDGWVSH